MTRISRTTSACFLWSKSLMMKTRNLDLKESVKVRYKDSICTKYGIRPKLLLGRGWVPNNHFLKSVQKQPYADVLQNKCYKTKVLSSKQSLLKVSSEAAVRKCSSEYWSSPPEEFLRKGVLKICSKFTRKHPCWSEISIKSFCRISPPEGLLSCCEIFEFF